MTENQSTPSTAKRWTMRGLAVSALVVPLFGAIGGTASAAEITPIAEYVDDAVASTSESLIEAGSALLGVS